MATGAVTNLEIDQVKLICEIHKGNGYCGASNILLGEDVCTKTECIVKVVNLDADARQVYHVSESLADKIALSNSKSVGSVSASASSTSDSLFSPKRDLCAVARHELSVLRSLKHRNVVSILNTSMLSNYLHLYFELLEFGSVRDVLDMLNYGNRTEAKTDIIGASRNDAGGQLIGFVENSDGKKPTSNEKARGLSEFAIAYIVHAVLHALRYLHSAGIIHRSVRPAHILLGSPHRVVLGGFELAFRTSPVIDDDSIAATHEESRSSGVIEASKRCFDYSAALVDGIAYAAPECIGQDQRGYDALSDVYSVGICVTEMWNGFTPFSVGASAEPLSVLAAKARNEIPRLRSDSEGEVEEKNRIRLKDERETDTETKAARIPSLQDFVGLCCAVVQERATVDSLLKNGWLTEFCGDEDADRDEAEQRLTSLADIYAVWLADCAQPVARRARARDAASRLSSSDMAELADVGASILRQVAETRAAVSTYDIQWAFA